MSVLDNWEQWKEFLGERLDGADSKGLTGSAVNEMAYRIGDYLASEVEAKTPEEKILSDLWRVADEQEQHTIANLMLKYIKNK
jgi:hypothetical protein